MFDCHVIHSPDERIGKQPTGQRARFFFMNKRNNGVYLLDGTVFHRTSTTPNKRKGEVEAGRKIKRKKTREFFFYFRSTMEVEFGSVDEVKSKARGGGGGEEEEKKEKEVGQNGIGERGNAGSAEGIRLLGNKLLPSDNSSNARPMAMPTSGVNAADLVPSQLTIFYGGRVCVFDAIPAEKVCEIMLIAAAAAAAATNSTDLKNIGANCSTSSPVLTRSPSLQSTESALSSPRPHPYPVQRNNSFCKLQAELPMARRHSLQRFLEKRRDRLVSKNPYSAESVSKVSDETKANLSTDTSVDAGCFEKPPMCQELQPKAPGHVA